MKKLILLFAFACWTATTAQAQTVINVQTPTTSVANHDNPTPKDFSINAGTGLNETYLWSEETNLLQGININLQPSGESVIYMQQNNGRLAFHFTNNFIAHVQVKWDGGSWDILATTTQANHGWFTPQFSGNNSIGVHELDVRVTLSPSGTIINRKYEIKITEDCSHFYKDNFGNTVTVWEHSSGKKPIVLADGIDQGNTDYAELIRYEASNLATELISNNFSLWVLNCAKGGQDIESNAAMYASLVRYVSGINGNQPVVAAGISMGGQVSRWAVCEAEEHSHPLPITHWISFDSPHRNAAIDHDLQDFIFEHDEDNISLNATASKQLLNYSPFDGDGSVHNTFVNKRNSLNGGNYPQQCISIGVSFSNGLPNPHNNQTWLNVKIVNDATQVVIQNHDFKVKNSWSEAGSFLPALTGNSAAIFVRTPFYINRWLYLANVPLARAETTRSEDYHPTFVSLKSALDMDEHGNSPFCYTLYSVDPDNFSHHDRVPQDLVKRVVKLLQTSTLSDIASGTYHNFGGGEAPSTHNGFNVFGKMYVNGDIGTGSSANPQAAPTSNSLFRLSTSCNTDYITVKNGAELLIGSDSRGLKGEFVVRKGTTLSLESASLLVINNNSKLVIEYGSSLKFYPNSQIILNGSNAILEIRGNLEIMNGATFTVAGGANGMGKIIFNKNWTPDQPDYVGGNGNFVLNGTSKNTPHIEIYGNIGLKFGYGLNKVEIKNTEIIIDQPSTLCFLNNITKMENVKVSPINGMRHGGIKAVNRSQHFRNVDIYFAKTGITVFNNGYNGSMLLQDVTVSHSDYGIHAVGGCRINHNKGGLNNIGLTAFLGSGLLGNSGVRGVGISRDITFPMVVGGRVGLNVQGYAGGVFDIRRNTVVDFQTGVSVNNSRADLRCNNIFYNQTGIFASDAALSLVRNNLSNNDHSWTQYGGTYHIENGLNYFHANDFYFEHWNLAVSQYKYSNPAYVYNTNTPQYFVPDAQNAWGNNPLTGHKPADGFSYNKDYYINSVGLYPPPEPIMGNLAQNTPLSYNNFSNTDVTACPEINTSSSPMGTTTSSDISKFPPPMTYNSGVINGGWGGDIPVDGGSVDLVLNDIKNRIYDYNSIPDITSIVSNLSDILFYPYQMTETQVVLLPYVVNDDTLYVQDTIEVILIEEEALTSVLMNAYHLMLECVSRAHEVSSYELNDSFQLFYAVANAVLDNIDDLITLSQNNHFLWSAVPFNLYIDKTNIQRFVYELDNAQTTLTQATSYIALPFQQNIYERLSCILDAEISIRDSLTLPQDIESNHPCLFADYSNIPPMLQSMALSNKPLSNSKTDPTITIYPNPASKELFVQTAADAGTYSIYNITGSLVAAGRLKEKRIDISELSEGLYFIRLNTATQTYHAKFVVAKE